MIKWTIGYLFAPKQKRTYQERLDWNWFWKVEVVAWWEETFLYRLLYQVKAFFIHKKQDDDLPF